MNSLYDWTLNLSLKIFAIDLIIKKFWFYLFVYLLLFRPIIFIILHIDINKSEIYIVNFLASFNDLYYLDNFNEYLDMRILNASNSDNQYNSVFESSSESNSSNNNFNQNNPNNHNPIPDPNNNDDENYWT